MDKVIEKIVRIFKKDFCLHDWKGLPGENVMYEDHPMGYYDRKICKKCGKKVEEYFSMDSPYMN